MKWMYVFSLLMFASLTNAEVSQNDVSGMLDKMVKEGTISAVEAEKAKLKMKSMNGSEWSSMNSTAEKVAASRRPASIQETKSTDLDKAQFNQIEDDIKNMMPDHQD